MKVVWPTFVIGRALSVSKDIFIGNRSALGAVYSLSGNLLRQRFHIFCQSFLNYISHRIHKFVRASHLIKET